MIASVDFNSAPTPETPTPSALGDNALTKKKPLTPLQQRLLEGLNVLPEDISLCLLDGEKAPHGAGWQANPFTKAQVAEAIVNGITLRNTKGEEWYLESSKIKGYGIITGTLITVNGERHYVMALDNDGPSAGVKVTELSGGLGLPKTLAFTSGREGRCQFLLVIPEDFAPNVQSKIIITQPKTETQELEQLEFRWTGHQSVLPPSVHPLTGEYVYVQGCAFEETEIAIAPDWVLEQMLTDKAPTSPNPTVEAPPKFTRTTQTKNQWSNREWALSYLESLSPSRADNYDDWVTVGMALHSVGDDSLLVDWDAWSRNSTKYKPGECDKKWRSFGKRSGRKLGTLGFLAKVDGWRSPFEKPSGRSYAGGIGSGSGGNGGNGNKGRGTGGSGGSGDGGDGNDGNGDDNGKVVKFPGADPETQEWIFSEIDTFIAQGVTGSQLTAKLNRLAAASQIYVGELRKLYYERLNESDLEVERDANQGEIEKLLTITETSLDLNDYLPSLLAQPITLWCNWMAIRPAVALTALLAGVSSLHAVGTELVIRRNQNFRVNGSINSAIVSESGQKKSPILANLIRLPLNKLSEEKEDGYKAAMEDYKTALKAWEASKDEDKGDKPEEPEEPRLYYFTNATGEAIPIQAQKAPDKALFALIDELSGLFNSANSYRGGKGSDKQDFLSYFDGTGQTVLRAVGVKAKLQRMNLSIFGTIQPEILKRHIGDCSDPDGQWARFLFVNQPLEASTLADDDEEVVQVHELLADVYRQIDNLPVMEYRLSRQAFKRYQPVYAELERLRVTHPKGGMRAVYSKMEGYIGRLALNLHVLWELAAGKACPDEEIPLYILEMAIRLAKFYFGQVKLIHADSDDESVPTQILRLVELSKRLDLNGKDGWIKAQAYREQFASKKRPSAQQARDWMVQAVTLGYGRTRGSGNRLEYFWKSGENDGGNGNFSPTAPPNLGNLGKLREDLGNTLPYVESVENKGFEDNLGNLGKGTPTFSQTPTVEDSLRQSDTPCVDVRESNVEAITSDPPPNSGESLTPNFTEKSLEGGSVPEASLTSLSEPANVDVERDTHLGNNLGNPFPNSSLTSLTEGKADEAPQLRDVAHKMICCAVAADVETLYAEVPQDQIHAAKELLADEERLTFEAIANGCATISPRLNANLKVDPIGIPDWEATQGKEVFGGFRVGDRVRFDDGRQGVVCDPESDSTPCVLNAQDEPIWYEDLVPVWFDVYEIGQPVAWFMAEMLSIVGASEVQT
jgi:hypothetical protein